MNTEIDYGCFPRLREVVMGCGLETQEEKELAFESLVRCLISKNVFQSGGEIVHWRNTCLGYFSQISSRLESDDLELMVESVEEFYQRFIFAPTRKWRSLFSEFQEIGVNETFNGILVSEIFEEYRKETGYSPYEKTSKEEIHSFLDSVEASMYALV